MSNFMPHIRGVSQLEMVQSFIRMQVEFGQVELTGFFGLHIVKKKKKTTARPEITDNVKCLNTASGLHFTLS